MYLYPINKNIWKNKKKWRAVVGIFRKILKKKRTRSSDGGHVQIKSEMTLHFGYLAKATQIIKSYCLIVNTEPT